MRCPKLSQFPPPPPGKMGWPWTEESKQLPERMSDGSPWPRISIVTPSYNQGRFIEETIRSVLLQGYPNLEYRIIDGGSADESIDIIKKYSHWIEYWVSEEDNGQADAINKGFEGANGNIYGYLNSDDLLAPGALNVVGNRFKSAPPKAVIAFSGERLGPQGARRVVKPEVTQWARVWLSTDMSLLQTSAFWTSRLHRLIGGFDTSLHFAFDKDFFFQAVFIKGQYYAERGTVCSLFRVHSKSKTMNLVDLKWRENKLIWRRYSSHKKIKQRLSWEQGHDLIIKGQDQNGVLKGLAYLAKSLVVSTSLIRTRFFWGGARRILAGVFRKSLVR